MKKKILGLALIAISLVSFGSMAQTTSNNGNNTTTTKENIKCKKADKKKCRAQVNPFEGLNITDAQKAQLRQLNDKRKADRQQQDKIRKDNKQRNDSARMADRRAAKKAYLKEVKAIIGPEQYVMFLENMYVNGNGNRHDKAAFGKDKANKSQAHRNGKNGKADRKNHRGHHAANRAAKTNAAANS